MPRATTWRQDAALIQLGGDSAHAGEPLRAQVVHDGPQVAARYCAFAQTAATAVLTKPACKSEDQCPPSVLNRTKINPPKNKGVGRSFRWIPIEPADTLYQHEAAVLLTAICDQVCCSGRNLIALTD